MSTVSVSYPVHIDDVTKDFTNVNKFYTSMFDLVC